MKDKLHFRKREILTRLSKVKVSKVLVIYAVLSAISLGGYFLTSWITYHPGFPLDDAWIHQTYARNLALHGEWYFTPGNKSAGSTSPAWTAILAVGYLLAIKPLAWTYFAGWLVLTTLTIFGALTYKRLSSAGSTWWFFAGGFLIFEWHLVWAAASGMETALAALFPLIILVIIYNTENNLLKDEIRYDLWIISGLLIGISIWIRPDGLSLVVIPGILLVTQRNHPWAWRAIIYFVVGFMIPVLAYIAMNVLLGGGIWPNTYYAKQAEYEILRDRSYLMRYLQQARTLLIGPGFVLLPGFLWFVYASLKDRLWLRVAGIIWILLFLGLYAWRLPVTYQHGRYVMPVMPVFFLMGMAGLEALIGRLRTNFHNIYSLGLSLILVGVISGFWLIGARTYALDVAIIESEMVASSLWIRNNTDPEAVIAAHDIGALGYFGERKIVDLAGLVSPEVIPYLRDEGELAKFIEKQNAEYLMTFPGWYPKLIENGSMVFSTSGVFSPMAGGENMAVFLLKKE